LEDVHQRRAKRKTDNHCNRQRQGHFHDGPAQVFQMLEKRLGGLGFRRIAKSEDVSQRHLTGSSTQRERQKIASGKRGADAKCVSVANFVLRNHVANLFAGESPAIKNRFAFLRVWTLYAALNSTGEKEITALIGKPR